MIPLIDSYSRTILLANGRLSDQDHYPVIKLFNPCGAATWLFTELDGDDVLFGLCDLGIGCPELGSVSVKELMAVSAALPVGLERDLGFQAVAPISVYARAASRVGRITEERSILSVAARS